MKITILTLFPEMFSGFLEHSIVKRARAKQVLTLEIINIRDFTKDKYNRVDTPPIGGGAGLVMKAQPIVDALQSCSSGDSHRVLLSPRGATFNQAKAHAYAKTEHLVLVCGHYEGVDERVNQYINEEVSIGDYILTGGELGAAVISDAVIRLLEGAIASDSTMEESHEGGLLEYPHFTEPYDFNGQKVPQILYSGNHQAIGKWRQLQRLLITRVQRPDLFAKYTLTKTDKKLLAEFDQGITPKWITIALEKGKKFTKETE